MKKLIIALASILIIAGASIKHQNKIYYISDSMPVNGNYKLLALDENGEGFYINSTDNIKGQWITGDSIKLRWSIDEYIYNYKLMD